MKHSLKKLDAELARMAAEQVVAELNAPRTLKSEAVARLAAMLSELQELQRREANEEPIRPDELNPVNEYLARHRWITQLVVASLGSGSSALYWEHVPVVDSTDIRGAPEQRLASAVSAMAADGTLELIQCCTGCGKWFRARRRPYDPSAGTFCKGTCQQRYWRHKPEVKAKKREYQKKYYRDYLSPVTRKPRKKRRHAA